jgi:hypothetical protein
MRRFFPERLCEFRNCLILCYLLSSAMIGYYAHKSYKIFFAEKQFMMEIASYKIATDLVNIFNHAEVSLNEINNKIALSDHSKSALHNIMIAAGKSYDKTLLKYELSTGRYYWINASNLLIANSETGLISNQIDLSNRDYLQNTVKDPRKICVGQPIVGVSSGQYVIPMGVGAEDARGRYVGTMAVSFKLADLAVRYREISHLYNVNFALLSANNEVIFESGEGIFAQDKRLFDDLSMEEINETEEFVAPFSLNKRANSYVMLRVSDKYQYKVLAGYRNQDLRQELALKMAYCLLQFLIMTMFFMLAMFYLRKECDL